MKKFIDNEFIQVWSRIQKETDIRTFIKLAEIIGISQPAISKAKARGRFPIDWAYEIGHKYGILTEWIMTGEGPKRLGDTQTSLPEPVIQTDSVEVPVYFADLITWGREFSGSGNLEWLENLLDSCLPAFKKWREEKSTAEATLLQDQVTEKKVA